VLHEQSQAVKKGGKYLGCWLAVKLAGWPQGTQGRWLVVVEGGFCEEHFQAMTRELRFTGVKELGQAADRKSYFRDDPTAFLRCVSICCCSNSLTPQITGSELAHPFLRSPDSS
jgi:hypothetical protein